MSKQLTRKVVSVFIPLLITVLACSCPETGLGGQTPGPVERDTPLSPPSVLLEDDFSDPDSGWEEGEYPGGSVGYENGVYAVTAAGGEGRMWGLANEYFEDIIIEVDATQIAAPANDNNAYGVVCREQGDEDGSEYYLLISGDGAYAIAKIEGEEVEYLAGWTASDAVRQGNATNHIRAVCDGSTLTLFANGERLATAEDVTFEGGDIAFTATSLEDEPTVIHFDNLVAREP